MTKKLILASAGAGKTYRIVSESIEQINAGKRILVITYTRNNQKEILDRFAERGAINREQVHVKGLFTFLLEDMIRPYQTCIFTDRIETINFNKRNPHKRDNYPIKGRQEKNDDDTYNSLHFLTQCKAKAHTIYISKLASNIITKSKGKPIERLEKIYNHIYIDEVQDLVGWDYEVLQHLAKSKLLDVTCVGDFRQTIYDTSVATKQPKTNEKKIAEFKDMQFDFEPMNISRRSIQCVCDLADRIHANENYEKTQSCVKDADIPEKYREHIGVFVVKKSDETKYVEKYNPTLLRHSVTSGKQFAQTSLKKINFGKSKGSGFDRVLILPTDPYREYLTGNLSVFDKNKTDEPKNKLYVAMTRAKYSLAFLIEDKYINNCGLPIWNNMAIE